MQLHSRTRYNVGVYYDEIKGTQDDNDLHSKFDMFLNLLCDYYYNH